MFLKQIDFLAIGDITTDAFIRLKEASVHCNFNHEKCELCMGFGTKLPYDFVEVVKAVGNSANAAVSAARLGLNSGLVAQIGTDQNGKDCLDVLKKEGVSTRWIEKHHGMETNYHYVLWYESERTILVKHQPYKYKLSDIRNPKWIYLSSLGENTLDYQNEISEYLKNHKDIKLAFQPGTFQINLGHEKLKDIYQRSEVFICNKEESQTILKNETNDIKELLQKMHDLGPKIVLITDGPNGAYAYENGNFWFMSIYPDPKPAYERTGAGDAFASTFVSALALGKNVEEALRWAPINSMSVVQYVGAQKGLLDQKSIELYDKNSPDSYRIKRL
jgi:ribokinase